MRAALYERVSTDAQAERYGIGAQHYGLVKRVQERGYDVVSDGDHDAFVDDGQSASTLERPALDRLRHLLREGKVDVLLCYDPDRLSRDLAQLLLLSSEAEAHGVKLEFITQETDASPEGKMFFAMRGAVAEYERAKIRERTIRGRLEKARQGKVISRAAAPFGYRYDPQTSMLVVHEEEAKVVRLAFHLYTQERISIVQLANRLNRLGLARARGGYRWHQSMLGGMLRNEAYAGILWQNRWQEQRVQGKGKKLTITQRTRPKEEQIAVTVPAIVSREMFDAAQRRLEENSRLAPRNSNRDYLLSGLLRHACGSSMGARTHRGTAYYYCFKSLRAKAPVDERGEPQLCSCGWVNATAVEAEVWKTITSLLQHPDLLVQELERISEPGSPTREVLEEELAHLKKRLEDLPREERRLVEGYRKGLYADFMMREQMEKLHRERDDAERRRRELELQLARLDRAGSYRGQIGEFAAKVSQGLEHMDAPERRELLRLLVDEVVYDGGKLTIKTIIPLEERQLHPQAQGARG